LPSKFKPALIGTGFWLLSRHIDCRRTFEARPGRAPVQPYRRQVDENSRLCLAYTKFREIKTWLKNTEAWQAVRAFGKSARQYLTEIKKFSALQHLKVASRRVVQANRAGCSWIDSEAKKKRHALGALWR
jgi:hypothetical protein